MSGRVIGVCVCTRKDEQLVGRKLLAVQPIKSDGSPAGKPALAVDLVGAGAGEVVLLTKSRDASLAAGGAPVDLAIVGIADHMTTPPHRAMDLKALGFKLPATEGGP
ncbi:MAG TPA: EutN/CcmL family microcompartment protein [Symbiobacteriaceae bacterium]|jgi:ethanolamine utilization protein EutN